MFGRFIKLFTGSSAASIMPYVYMGIAVLVVAMAGTITFYKLSYEKTQVALGEREKTLKGVIKEKETLIGQLQEANNTNATNTQKISAMQKIIDSTRVDVFHGVDEVGKRKGSIDVKISDAEKPKTDQGGTVIAPPVVVKVSTVEILLDIDIEYAKTAETSSINTFTIMEEVTV